MKKPLKIILIVILIIVLAALAYLIYMFAAYHRIEDNVELEVKQSASDVKHPVSGKEYRLVSNNVGFGAYSPEYTFFMDGGTEGKAFSKEEVIKNISGSVSVIADAKPDFIFIQELDTDGDRSYNVDQSEIVYDKFPEFNSAYAQNFDSPYIIFPLKQPHGANKAGILTLSEFEITSSLRRSLPLEDTIMKLADLDRCYSVSRVPMEDGKELVLFNFHLSAYTSDGIIAEEQLRMLFEDMKKEVDAGNYAIAGGDFNKDVLGNSDEVFGFEKGDRTWVQSIPEELVPEEFTIIGPTGENVPVPSCRDSATVYGPDDFVVTVDGFIVSDNVEVVRSHVIDSGFLYSDHNPVYMDFILK